MHIPPKGFMDGQTPDERLVVQNTILAFKNFYKTQTSNKSDDKVLLYMTILSLPTWGDEDKKNKQSPACDHIRGSDGP